MLATILECDCRTAMQKWCDIVHGKNSGETSVESAVFFVGVLTLIGVYGLMRFRS